MAIENFYHSAHTVPSQGKAQNLKNLLSEVPIQAVHCQKCDQTSAAIKLMKTAKNSAETDSLGQFTKQKPKKKSFRLSVFSIYIE